MTNNRVIMLVRRASAPALLLVLLAFSAGCLNPDLVNSATGSFYPTAPGNDPFVMVRVINDTTAELDVPIVYDNGVATPTFFIRDLNPGGRDTGVVLLWPILRLAIGDLSNPIAPTINATFANGNIISVPFGYPALQAGIDYNRGDTVIFRIVDDARSPSYMSVSVGLIDGTTQEGQFSRADPFQALQLLLLQYGFITAIPLGGGT